jgi:hypothetical protein
VLAYVQRSLDGGSLRLAISSLHLASQGGSPSMPRFYTREFSAANAATLEVTLVPEPTASAILCAAAGALGLRRRRHARCV